MPSVPSGSGLKGTGEKLWSLNGVPGVSDRESKAVDGVSPDDFTLPSMRPRDLLAHFGPGMILMMTGIGTSHLVTAPTAGGRFAYALLWCLPVAYVFKYYGFEMAFRFTNATGKSLLEAYATARWKWPLWYVMVTTLVQCAIGQAGRLIAAAAVLYYLVSETLGLPLPLEAYAALLGLLSVAIILRGSYRAIENTTKTLAGVLVVSSLAVYFVQPAPLAAMGHFFLVEIPGGSWLVIAGFLGLLPTGIDVSLQASEWGEGEAGGHEQDPAAPRRGRCRAPFRSVHLAAIRSRGRYLQTFPPRARILPPLVPDRSVGLPHGALRLVLPRRDLRTPRRGVALPESDRGTRGHGGDRRDFHAQRGTVDDGDLHPRDARGYLFHRLQLL